MQKAAIGLALRMVVASPWWFSRPKRKARTAAVMFRVGEPPMPDAPEGVTVKTVEVREVLAAV